MKKIMFIIPALILILTACGSTYDPEIEDVLEKENSELSGEELTRDETNITVYAEGGYIELEYEDESGEMTSVVYEDVDGEYQRASGRDAIDDLSTNYTEENI